MLYLMMYEDENSSTVLYQNPITDKSVRLDFDKESEPIKSMKTDDEYILHLLNKIRLDTDKTNFKIMRKLYYSKDGYTEPLTESSRYLDYYDEKDGIINMFVEQSVRMESN